MQTGMEQMLLEVYNTNYEAVAWKLNNTGLKKCSE